MDKKGKLLQELAAIATDKKVSCPQALALANRLGVSPLTVGNAANELGLKIIGCQLGCFR
ncbi:MAG: hypothetical protein ACOX3A_06720 [bacterium]|jgi:predicted dinucleotide-binding enzyme